MGYSALTHFDGLEQHSRTTSSHTGVTQARSKSNTLKLFAVEEIISTSIFSNLHKQI